MGSILFVYYMNILVMPIRASLYMLGDYFLNYRSCLMFLHTSFYCSRKMNFPEKHHGWEKKSEDTSTLGTPNVLRTISRNNLL